MNQEEALTINQPYMSAEDNQSIVEKRWESQEFIWELWKSLADREPRINPVTGATELVRINPDIPPLMNDKGAQRIIQLVRSKINPVVALSKISDEDARSLWGDTIKKVAKALVLGKDDYGVQSTSDMIFIVDTIKTLTFCQVMRAVGGHESKWSKTQIQEYKQDSYQEQRTSGGFLGFGKKRGYNNG